MLFTNHYLPLPLWWRAKYRQIILLLKIQHFFCHRLFFFSSHFSMHIFLLCDNKVCTTTIQIHFTLNCSFEHCRLKWSFTAVTQMLGGWVCVCAQQIWLTCLTPDLWPWVLPPQAVMDRMCRRRKPTQLACLHRRDIDEFARSKRRWFVQARPVFMPNSLSLTDIQRYSRRIVCLRCRCPRCRNGFRMFYPEQHSHVHMYTERVIGWSCSYWQEIKSAFLFLRKTCVKVQLKLMWELVKSSHYECLISIKMWGEQGSDNWVFLDDRRNLRIALL